MKGAETSPVGRLLAAISLFCYRRPWTILLLSLVTFSASLFITQRDLNLEMDWTALFDEKDPVVVRVEEQRQAFPISGDIAVLVDQGTREQREAFIELLADRLSREPEVFYYIYYKFDLELLRSKALYYLSVKELKQLEQNLGTLTGAASASGGPLTPTGKKVLKHLLEELQDSLRNRGNFNHTPIWEVLAEGAQGQTGEYLGRLLQGDEAVYQTLGAGRIHVLAFKPGPWGQSMAPKSKAVVRIRQILEELGPTAHGLRLRLTGLPVMLYDERKTCTDDSIRSAALSMVLILVIFVIGFGEASRPTMAISALTCGLGWTLGYTTLVVGHLNFITVTMVTMLMGLGIDFGIHIIFRFSEEQRDGASPEKALENTLRGTGLDTLIGAVATAVAFMALTQTGFRGLADLGVIAAGGVLLCYLATITVLPAMLALRPGVKVGKEPGEMLVGFEKGLLGRPFRVTGLGVVLILLALSWGTKVDFDYNLLKIQSQELESIRTEIEMIHELKTTVLSAVTVAKDLEQARHLARKFEALPTVARVSSVVPLIPADIDKKQPLIESICRQVENLQLPEPFPLEGADDLRRVQSHVNQLEKRYSGGGGDPAISAKVDELKSEVRSMDPGPIVTGLGAFQQAVHKDMQQTFRLLKAQRPVPPRLEDLPEALKVRSISDDGQVQVKIQPTRNIWERKYLKPFLEELRSVDPEVSGHPVVQQHILEAFGRAHRLTPWYTLLGVLTVMLFYLRGLAPVVMSLLPTAAGVVGIIGAMGYVGVDFNVVNMVALPISVGIGAVYGVHALHRMRELGDETVLTSSTGPALLLSGVTTMVGFASLMTAHHRGLASLGFVIAVGVAVNLIVSLCFLPAFRRGLRTFGKPAAASESDDD